MYKKASLKNIFKELFSWPKHGEVTLKIKRPILDINNLTYDISYTEPSNVKAGVSRRGETPKDSETDPEDLEA